MCDVHLVISRCDEDVDWLQEVVVALIDLRHRVCVFVYDKGVTGLPANVQIALEGLPAVLVEQTRLPNVGRESHTYLKHVIRHRARSAGKPLDNSVTVFLQGRMQDHVPGTEYSITSFVASMVKDASCSSLGESSNHSCHTQFGSFNAVRSLQVSMFPGVGRSGVDLGTWFNTVLGRSWTWKDPLEGPTWWQHGVFAVCTARLLVADTHATDAYYHSLLSQVDWHVNPEAGHFFERSWYFVFPPLPTE